MGDERQARRFFVSGGVQGVGFRYFTQNEANRIGVCGYVRNLRDGRVEVYAIGSEDQMAELRRSARCGPIGASVSGVKEEPAAIEAQYEREFSITFER